MSQPAPPILQFHRCREGAQIPAYATDGAAGMDLTAALEQPVTLKAGERAFLPTGLKIALPPGHEAQIRPRSGLAARHGVTVLNSPGTIDEDYRGEVSIILINHSADDFIICSGERIAQMVIAPITRVSLQEQADPEALGGTQRGEGGFGSTGR